MKWYAGNINDHQGLVADEDTGENIAVVYNKKNAPLIASAPALLEALKEIAKKEGPFSTDQLTHAGNVIENMARIAEKAIHDVKEKQE